MPIHLYLITESINLIGNGVVSAWEGTFEREQARKVLNGETDLEADSPEVVLDIHDGLIVNPEEVALEKQR